MPYTPTAEIVADAVAAGRGVVAFDVIGLEHAEAVVSGAEWADRPVLLQISQNAVAFRGRRLRPLAAACRELAAAAKVRVGLHLDHVEDEELTRQAADAGFGSLMVDASRAPYAENVARTRALVDWAHEHGLWVEAELGGTDGPAHVAGARTDPAAAAEFVAATGIDGLAVAVGTARLDIDLVAALHEAAPVPLVLHGSSGVTDDELRRALGAGIVKVNVGTALDIACTAAVRELLLDACVVDPRRYLAPAMVDMAAEVERYLAVIS